MKVLTSLLLLALLGAAQAAAEDGSPPADLDGRLPMEDVREVFKEGWIDWTNSRVHAWGRSVRVSPSEEGEPQNPARMSAIVEARQRMVKILAGLRLDSESVLSDGEGRRDLMVKLADSARVAQERKRRGRFLEIRLELPLHGTSGLGVALLGLEKFEIPPEAESFEKRKRRRLPTGLVIDARGTDLRAAYLPRILAPGGRVLWSVEQAHPFTQRSRGLAVYARLRRPAGPEPAETAWRSHPVLSRMGRRPAVLRAAAASGALRADVVLEEEAAKELESSEILRELLSMARLVIVLDRADPGPAPSTGDRR